MTRVPGVGPVTALYFRLTIEDAGRFQRSRDVGSYFGLVPKQQDSGESTPQLRISKAGDEGARRLLVSCAHYILVREAERTSTTRPCWGCREPWALCGGRSCF